MTKFSFSTFFISFLFYFSIANGFEIKEYGTFSNVTNEKIDLNQIIPKISTLINLKTNFTDKLIFHSSKLNTTESSIILSETHSSNLTEKTTADQIERIKCEENDQLKVKIDCKRYFRCIKTDEKYLLKIFSCSKGEYFDNENGSCNKSTNVQNNCDLNENYSSNSTKFVNGKKISRKNKNRPKIKKKNRSLNSNGVVTLNLNDFNIGNDFIDLDSLSHRVDNRLSDKVKSSHIIVITGDDDENDNYETNYESYEMNEQTDDNTNENDKLDEKKSSVDELPCNKRKDSFDRINSSDKEIIVKNLTEVHNHINNTIINILPDKNNRNNYLSPKEKINEKNFNQKHETENYQSHEIDDDRSTSGPSRRTPKNVTNVTNDKNNENNFGKNKRTHKNITTIITEEEQTNSDSNKSQNLSDQNKPKERDRFNHHSDGNNDSKIIIKNITSKVEDNRRQEIATSTTGPSIHESNNENVSGGRRIIKNTTTIIEEENESNHQNNNQLSDKKKEYTTSAPSSSIRESNSENTSGGRRIIKNITTIIEEEGESNNNQFSDKKKEYTTITPSPSIHEPNSENASGSRRIIKNITTIIEEENESNHRNNNQLSDKKKEYTTSAPITPSSSIRESNSENTSGGRRIIKNITTIIEEEGESSNNHRNNNQFSDKKIEYTTEAPIIPSPSISIHEPNSENASGGRRIIKNITTIIEEEGESNKNQVNKNLEENDKLEHINHERKPNESKNLVEEPNNENGKRRVVKNITTIIEEESESSNNHRNNDQFPDLKKEYTTSTTITPSPSIRETNNENTSGGRRVIKNITTIIEEESNNHRINDIRNEHTTSTISPIEEKNIDNQFENNNYGKNKRVHKNVTTTIITEESNDSDKRDNESINDSRVVKNNTLIDDNNIKSNSDNLNNDQSHNGKRTVIKNTTTIITTDEEEANKNNQINKDLDENDRLENKNEVKKPNESKNLEDDYNNEGGRRKIIKNITTIITEEEQSNQIDKQRNKFNDNKSTNEDINQSIKPNTNNLKDNHSSSGSRIIKNVTTTISTEEESNDWNNGDNTNEKKENEDKNIVKPFVDNESIDNDKIAIKNVSTIVDENRKDQNESNENLNDSNSINKNHNGKRVIFKNTTITEEITEEGSNGKKNNLNNNKFEENKSTNEDQNQSIKPNTDNLNDNHSSSGRIIKNVTTTIITEENSSNNSNKDSIYNEKNNENINSKKEFSELPCNNNKFQNLRPIAKIIETHHVVKYLFGLNNSSFINSLNNSFTRFVKKNVTKIIKPNNLDDATSMIIGNGSDYLVNEIHDIEEKVIFENQFSDSLSPHSSNSSKESSTNRPTNNTNIDIINPIHSTIDSHGPLSSTTPSSFISSNNPLNDNYLTSTQRPTYIDDMNGQFNGGEPQGPIYLDETNDCKFEGFHRFEFDCRRFYLCRLDQFGRFTIEEFLCVPNQVFNLEKRVCVYENDYNCVISLNSKLESNSTESNKRLNKISLEKDSNPVIVSTGIPILFTELIPKMKKNQNTETITAKPANSVEVNNNSEGSHFSSSNKPEHYSAATNNELINAGSNSNLIVRVRPITSMNKFSQVQQEKGQFQSSSSFISNNNHRFMSYAQPPLQTYFNSLPADPILSFERNYPPPLIPYNNYPLIRK